MYTVEWCIYSNNMRIRGVSSHLASVALHGPQPPPCLGQVLAAGSRHELLRREGAQHLASVPGVAGGSLVETAKNIWRFHAVEPVKTVKMEMDWGMYWNNGNHV